MYRQVVIGVLGGGLGQCPRGAGRGRDRAGPGGLGGGLVIVGASEDGLPDVPTEVVLSSCVAPSTCTLPAVRSGLSTVTVVVR